MGVWRQGETAGHFDKVYQGSRSDLPDIVRNTEEGGAGRDSVVNAASCVKSRQGSVGNY